jgi:hypothetical protein
MDDSERPEPLAIRRVSGAARAITRPKLLSDSVGTHDPLGPFSEEARRVR